MSCSETSTKARAGSCHWGAWDPARRGRLVVALTTTILLCLVVPVGLYRVDILIDGAAVGSANLELR
jgi:hypothetical protein